jgi:hypothetical protein
MRKSILALAGAAYIIVALVGWASPASGGFFSGDKSYNIFLGVLGLLALACADMGGLAAKWFDFVFGLLLIVMTIVGAANYLYFGTANLGNILMNGIASILLLYIGLIVNHRLKYLKHQEK